MDTRRIVSVPVDPLDHHNSLRVDARVVAPIYKKPRGPLARRAFTSILREPLVGYVVELPDGRRVSYDLARCRFPEAAV